MKRRRKKRPKTEKERQQEKAARRFDRTVTIISFGIPILIMVIGGLNASLSATSAQDFIGRFIIGILPWLGLYIFLFLAYTGKLKGKPKKQGQQKSKQKRKPK